MRKLYSYLSLGLVSVMSLASCSRSDYAFKAGAGSYHTAQSVSVAQADQPVAEVAPVAAPAEVAVVAAEEAPVAIVKTHKVAAQPVAAKVAVAKVTKPSIVEKALTAKLLKKVNKHSETAGVDQAQSKAGKAAIVALIGLLLLVLGGAAGIGLIALLGLLALIVGFVMLIAALINS